MSSKWFSCGRAEPDDREELTRTVTCKVVVVGDGMVGKTSLLTRYVTNQFDERYEQTIFDNQAAPVTVGKKKVLLHLFDTAGQEGYEHLRQFMYPETDVVLMCFAVDNPPSLVNIVEKWHPEVRLHLTKAPILLLGLKTDLRSRSDLSTEVTSRRTPSDSINGNVFDQDGYGDLWEQRLVSYSEGQKMATDIRAKAYFECSAKLNQGLTPIFQEAARLHIARRRGSSISSIKNLFSPRASYV